MRQRIRTSSLMAKLDILSPNTIRKMVREGRLPRPYADFDGGPHYWFVDEVEKQLELNKSTPRRKPNFEETQQTQQAA